MSDNSIKKNNVDIDLDEIMAQIRAKVSQRSWDSNIQPSNEPTNSQNNISTIRSIISSADTYADAGATVTPMLQFHGLTRKAALFAGKIIVYMASFITEKQRSFNKAIISALRGTADSIERMGDIQSRKIEPMLNDFSDKIRSLRQDKDRAIEEINNKLNERDRTIEDINNRLGEEINSKLNERDRTIEDINNRLGEKDRVLEEINGRLRDKDRAIEEINNGLSDITNKLSYIGRLTDEQCLEFASHKSKEERILKDIISKLDILSRTGDALYQELMNQGTEIKNMSNTSELDSQRLKKAF